MELVLDSFNLFFFILKYLLQHLHLLLQLTLDLLRQGKFLFLDRLLGFQLPQLLLYCLCLCPDMVQCRLAG